MWLSWCVQHVYIAIFWHIVISKTSELKYPNLYLCKTNYSILETKSKTLLYVK